MLSSDRNLIEKIYAGTSSKQDVQEVVDWFSSSVEGQQYLSDLLDKDAYLLEQEINTDLYPNEYQSERIYRNIRQKIKRIEIRRIYLQVAAVFLPFLILAGLTFYVNKQVDLFGNSEFTELYVPKGEKARLFFQDGSEVLLNADSKIKYPKKFGFAKRNVYLEGEAYFKVSSNKRRPFVVHTGKTSVLVLGTSFNVNAYKNDEEIKVVLDEGKIVFNTNPNRYQVSPGQKFVYDKNTGQATIFNLKKSSDESMWKENYIRLKDTPLSETLKILNRKYNTPFNVIDKETYLYTFTLTTKDKPLDFILNELEKIAPLKFTSRSDTIFVQTGK